MLAVEAGLYEACMKAIEAWEVTQKELDLFTPFIQKSEKEPLIQFGMPSKASDRPTFWDLVRRHKFDDLTPFSPILGCGTSFAYIPGFGNEIWWSLAFDGGAFCPMKEGEWLPVTDEFAQLVKESKVDTIRLLG